jgi:hypothetical protein
MNDFKAPCDPYAVLQAAVAHGINSHASFLEISVDDILNPAFKGIIAHAHEQLNAARP